MMPFDMHARQIFDDLDFQVEKMMRFTERVLTLPGDMIPIFWPDYGTVALASTFGGELRREGDGANIWIKPVLVSLDEVKNLEPPNPISGLVLKEFEACRKWRDVAGGTIPVSFPDIQGPVNIASMLIDTTELICGMYEKPEAVHRLLRLCTDVIISVVEAYRKEFGELLAPITWPHVWFPQRYGITLTQDSIPILSPKLYREFELPLVREISERLGGVYIHCCGEFEHVLEEVKEIPNLRGVDHAYPMSHADKILSALGTDITITSGVASRGDPEFPSYDLYLEHLLSVLPKGARFWPILPANDVKVTSHSLELLGLSEMREKYLAANAGS